MTVVSSKEFTTNQRKYYNKAISENVFIKRGKNMFIVSIADNKKDVDKQIMEFKQVTDNIRKINIAEPLSAEFDEILSKRVNFKDFI